MLNMLADKAYNYIKYGLNMLRIHPNNPSKWIFFDRGDGVTEVIVEYISNYTYLNLRYLTYF